MARPTLEENRNTKNDLLLAGMELVQTHGYNAFSYQDLANKLNIRKASIHYHFATKEELGLALLHYAISSFNHWSDKLIKQELSSTVLLSSYFDYFAYVSENGKRICPGGALSSEWDSLTPNLKSAVKELLSAHHDWLKKVLNRGRKNNEIKKIGTSEEQAQFIYAAIQGALQTSRAQNQPAYYRAVTRQLLSSLGA